ncbi:alkyl sulfatase dimerization domain-containing protein [Curtobacterium sp. USHLN213]|uniref:alkyl sulfatase dimerization domain-containing protein n=1 Tax=Curtobacterium sp. USHLN213 TaxID=3081255 RepID=UPI00301989AC
MRTVEEWEEFFDGFKDNLAPVVYDAGPSLTVTDADPRVHSEQTAWARQMGKRIYMPVAGRVYTAVGYQLCSPTMVVGDDGLIIIDPGFNDGAASEVMTDFRKFSDLPVRAVVYTHRHPDHAFAISGLGVSKEDVHEGRVDVITHESFTDWLINDASLIGPILGARSSLVTVVPVGPDGSVHGGLGPLFKPAPVSTFMPTITVGESEDLVIAGVRMTVFHAYGDAQDEIDAWFSDLKHVHGSETIQGESFPNLYTLRGTAYRDVELWRQGVDRLLDHAGGADSYSGSHMRPWVGNAFITERITNYRDAIQFLHDQTVRHINKGFTREELDLVAKSLPVHLRTDPWLQPYYGTPEHSVRNIYDGLLGWYQGDPTELATPAHHDKAARYVDALGGRDSVLAAAQKAIDAGERGWAMEILTHVVRVNHDDTEARRLKAAAMRAWAFQQKNMYWRNLALGGALELEDAIDSAKSLSFSPPDIVALFPPEKIIDALRVRVDAAAAEHAHVTVGFVFTDTGTSAALEIRRGVAVLRTDIPADAAATVTTTAEALRSLVAAGGDTLTIVDSPVATTSGNAAEFVACFEPIPIEPIRLVVR